MSLSYTLEKAATMMGLSVAPTDTARAVTGVSTDTRSLAPGDLFFALQGDNFDGNTFIAEAFARGASAAVTTIQQTGGPCLVHPEPLQLLQRFAKEHRRQSPATVIAITGSCGKTTTKDFAAALLASQYAVTKTQGNLNNEIGCPLSLLHISSSTQYALIEVGANHRGEIAFLCDMAQPNESAITMIAPAHLEGFGSLDAVAQTKGEIVDALGDQGCFYVNVDDPHCVAMAMRHKGDKILLGSHGDVVLESLQFDESGEMLLTIHPIGTIRLPLVVKAHSTGVLFAVAMGLRHGISEFEGPLREACKNTARFKVLPFHDRVILDDSYNANPASMTAALQTLSDYPGNKKIAVLGSMFELGDTSKDLHEEVGRSAGRLQIDRLFALGPDAAHLVSGARAEGLTDATAYESHDAIAEALRASFLPGDVLLLKGSRGMAMETIIGLLDTLLTSSL